MRRLLLILLMVLGVTSSAYGADVAPDGAALYAARCAACHDAPTDRTPTREEMSKTPPAFILRAMRDGAMAPMAKGLSQAEMVAVALHVSKVAGDPDPNAIWGPSAADMPLDGPRCDTPPPPIDLKARSLWNGWSPKPDNARLQEEPGLTAADVPRLRLKWAFNYPGSKNGQATVLGERLYVTSMSGALYLLNARTGCVYWRHVAQAATRSSVTIVALPEGAQAKHALFYSDWTKSAVALDADTGDRLWKTQVDDADGVQMTGAPTVFGGRLFVPISSGVEAFAADDRWECCKFRGSVVALDIVTGKVLWKTYTTAQEPKPFKTNRLGRTMWGPSGGAIWSAPTVDPKRGLIYVGTSNSYTDVPYDGSDAVMAIDMATGAVRWTNQLLANDNYINGCWKGPDGKRQIAANCPEHLGPDFSIGNSPILVDLDADRQLLVVGQKSGHVHALDPEAGGRIVWQRRLSPGSALGGVEFGMASDGERIFAGISDVVAGPDGKPGLYALRAADGRLLWSAPSPASPKCRWVSRWCHGAISQAVTAIPGVVFAGAYDGRFRAYRASDGQVIWEVDTGSAPIPLVSGGTAMGGVFDGAGPTVAGGMVYVHSGYAGRSGVSGGRDLTGADGNVLLAFSIEGR
jgi:polyvinyl alcohol dehydrogenase (cytochrome)